MKNDLPIPRGLYLLHSLTRWIIDVPQSLVMRIRCPLCVWVNVPQLVNLFSVDKDAFTRRNRNKLISVSKAYLMLDDAFCVSESLIQSFETAIVSSFCSNFPPLLLTVYNSSLISLQQSSAIAQSLASYKSFLYIFSDRCFWSCSTFLCNYLLQLHKAWLLWNHSSPTCTSLQTGAFEVVQSILGWAACQ